ncbi:Metallo-dependent phosphatase-like protein [Sporodiniella umbellata]|nr:Metallo-dependent phosphatase-like protein [Sporodiniella umbellata]
MKPVLIFTAYCFSILLIVYHWHKAMPFFVNNGLLSYPGIIGFSRFPVSTHKKPQFGYFLHITDVHMDEDYKENATFKSACHKSAAAHHLSGKWGSPGKKCDAPISLAEQTLKWISKEWVDKLDFVLWTGDNAKHDWDKKLKRRKKTIFESNQRMTDMMLGTFKNIPVIPSFGNNDVYPHNQMSDKDTDLLDFYTSLWKHWIPADQRATFRQGGYFTLRLPQLHIISLNTMFFFKRNKAVDSCKHPKSPAFKQLVWFEKQLKMAQSDHAKVYVIGHVPPSSRDYKSACLTQYMQVISRYTKVVEGHFFAHLNMDHFLIYDTKNEGDLVINKNVDAYSDWLYTMYQSLTQTQSESSWLVVQVSPSVLPVYYPTFRIYQYEINDNHPKLLGYSQYYSNLTYWNDYDHLEYELEYTTKDQYHMEDLSAESYFSLAKAMVNQNDLWSLYREHMVIKTKNFTDYDE